MTKCNSDEYLADVFRYLAFSVSATQGLFSWTYVFNYGWASWLSFCTATLSFSPLPNN